MGWGGGDDVQLPQDVPSFFLQANVQILRHKLATLLCGNSVKNVCPSCDKEDESSKHITICRDPGWRAMWRKSVQELASWAGATTSDLVLCNITERYLMGQDKTMMMDCLEVNASYTDKMLVQTHDKLGWGKNVKGRICRFFLEVVAPTFSQRSQMTPERWGRKLVNVLMHATHKQWLFRNSHVHYKRLEDLTEEQLLLIFRKVEESMVTDPADLVPRHYLLWEGDFTELGKGPTI